MLVNQGIQDLQFVQQKSVGIEGFGIIADASLGSVAHVMCADMADDFGILEIELDDIEVLSEEVIQSKLAIIRANIKKFVYFVIQLNDIPALAKYHIEEDEYIQYIRKHNEVLLEA